MPTATAQPVTRTSTLVSPSLDEIRDWLTWVDAPPTVVPVVREVMADTETPVSAYLKIRGEQPGFILESVEGGERIARYSFIGTNPLAMLTFRDGACRIERASGDERIPYDDPLSTLEGQLAPYRSAVPPGTPLPRFVGGAVGYLAYESIRHFEGRVGLAAGPGLGMDDGRFMLVDSLLVFDNVSRTIKVVSHVHLDDERGLEAAYAFAVGRIDDLVERLRSPLTEMPRGVDVSDIPVGDRHAPNTDPAVYRSMVETAQGYIAAGDIFQVVLSQRVDVPTPVDPYTIYRALRTVNPSPYMFFLDFVDHQIVGASPELLVRLEDGVVTNHPIAGTRKRGATPEEDARLAVELLADEKERAEHVMLVDLGRNDVGRVAKPGTVSVTRFMEIERFSHVMHIVSSVDGQIRDGMSPLDALRACFPAGTVSGAPKVRAMEIIAELEVDRRGAYSGAVGYVDFNGQMDTCIALRTLVFKDGVASIQAGGGIVLDSTPQGEYEETYHKMGALLRAIELAESIERSERPA